MSKRLVSFDDQATGTGLPAPVEATLNATYVRGDVTDQAGAPIPGKTARIVLDANGEIDDILIIETEA
ncbi:hypothetical protein GS921_00245 [Rhodococcus hoagii]|nr:hypothetical protein [Prescottella equi]